MGGFVQDEALIRVFPVPALRFSISNDLKFDAERDLKDIDASNIPVHALNKVSPGGITSKSLKEISFSLSDACCVTNKQKKKQAFFRTRLLFIVAD